MSYAAEPTVYSVEECNELVNQVLGDYVGTILVEGELSNVQIKRNQWVTFDLKDTKSVINCFASMFKIGHAYENGMQVRVLAKPRIYVPYGKYSLTVEAIQPVGAGALQIAYQLLVKQLTAEGLFDPQRKRIIPQFPEQIGLITSAEGAAIADVRKVLAERWGGFVLHLYPVHVQGKNAVDDVLRAIHYFNEHLKTDVIILTRGGGSLEDLQAFNDERIARAIFSSRIPIICAIGHEKDTTIAELVADQRAATPSHAAQLAVPDRATLDAQLQQATSRMQHQLNHALHTHRSQLEAQRQLIATTIQRILQGVNYQLVRYNQAVTQLPRKVAQTREILLGSEYRLRQLLNQRFQDSQQKLSAAQAIIQALDPTSVLRRGYSFTTDQESGKVIRTIRGVVPGQRLNVHLLDGVIESEVSHVN